MTSTAGAEIIDISKYFGQRVSSGSQAEIGAHATSTSTAAIRQTDGDRPRTEQRGIAELYPGLEDDSTLYRVQELAMSAVGICERAIEHLHRDEVVEADLETMRLSSLSNELFFCRGRMGEGFANMVDAISTSLSLLHGKLLEKEQVFAIRDCFDKLYHEPGISFDESLALVEMLSNVGLQTEPDLGGLVGDD
jgi:hypothetical protein